MSNTITITDYVRIIAKKCNHENDRQLDKKDEFFKKHFPLNIVLVGDDNGSYFATLNDKKEIIPISDKSLKREIYQFCNAPDVDLDFGLDMANCQKVLDRLMGEVPLIVPSDIVPIAQLSEGKLCYKKLAFDLDNPDGKTPLFDEIMGRWTNTTDFMKFIGSLFDPNADLLNYTWVYGAGRDSKGAVMRFLQSIFGHASVLGKSANLKPEQRFFTNRLLGKRLLYFPDENNFQMTTMGLFKSITGNDPITVEKKYGDAYDTYVFCKPMIYSNKKPNISSDRADVTRLIYVEAQKFPGRQRSTYERDLALEGHAWLSKCFKLWMDEPEFNDSQEHSRELAMENAEWAIDIFDREFNVDPSGSIRGFRVQAILNSCGIKEDKKKKEWFKIINDAYPVKKDKDRQGICYIGFSEKKDYEKPYYAK